MRYLVVALAYAVGQLPTGAFLARRAGIDVRRSGSGNIGATNVARTAGLRLGFLTLVGDTLKGALPVALGRAIDPVGATAAAAGLAAVLGHTFPIVFRFAGGKGVATALGALLALCPLAAAVPLATFAGVVLAYRYVSLASVAAALVAPLAVALLGYPRPVLGVVVTIAVVILVRHRDNLARLYAGIEPRFRLHKKQAPPTE